MTRRIRFGLFLLTVLWAVPALAQRQCNQLTPFSHTVPTGPVVAVPGDPTKQIYYCGFTLASKTNTLDFKIWASEAPDCSRQSIPLTPQWSLPNAFALNNRIETTGAASNYGSTLCFQTFGSGTLTGVIYWAQY